MHRSWQLCRRMLGVKVVVTGVEGMAVAMAPEAMEAAVLEVVMVVDTVGLMVGVATAVVATVVAKGEAAAMAVNTPSTSRSSKSRDHRSRHSLESI